MPNSNLHLSSWHCWREGGKEGASASKRMSKNCMLGRQEPGKERQGTARGTARAIRFALRPGSAAFDEDGCLMRRRPWQTRPGKHLSPAWSRAALLLAQEVREALAASWAFLLRVGRGWSWVKALVLLKFKSERPLRCGSSILVASSKSVNIAQCMLSPLCPPPKPPPQVSKEEKRLPFPYWMYLWCKYSLIADTVVRGLRAEALPAWCGRQTHTDLNSWDFYLSVFAQKICSELSSSRDLAMKKEISYFFFLSVRYKEVEGCLHVPSKEEGFPIPAVKWFCQVKNCVTFFICIW